MPVLHAATLQCSIGQESSRIWDQDYSLVIAIGCPVEVRDVNEEKRLELETE